MTKMMGFVFMALLLGGAIAAYIKLPKDEETTRNVRLFKFVIVVMALTMIGLFLLGAFTADITFKLF